MQGSKNYLKNHGEMPRISFKDGKAHTVKLIKDKEDKITVDGETIEGVKYLVVEDGDEKTFFTQSTSLIQMLSGYEEGTTVTIQMRSKKVNGKFQSYFSVNQGNTPAEEEADAPVGDDEEAPPQPSW